jgi:hypothetical protein
MKKDMTDYINSMIEDNLETLGKIISLQYRKFIRFYELVSEYSGSIDAVKYDFISPTSLDVSLTFESKEDLKKVKKEIETAMEKSKYDGSVKQESPKKDNRLFISIILEEPDDINIIEDTEDDITNEEETAEV